MPALPKFKEVEVQDKQEIDDLINRRPIMPKQQRPLSKKGDKKPKPTIQIAKAEMTLSGFTHTGKILRKKARLEARAIKGKRPDQVEVHSQSNRKSSLKASHVDIEDTSDSEDSQ